MTIYQNDFYGWTKEQSKLLKAGQFECVDVEHLVEELESMGASERRELGNRLALLMSHLLKWQFQPERRGRSWQLTIKEQRNRIQRVLRQNPSLRPSLLETVADVYSDARLMAARETDRDETAFPQDCPWSADIILNETFWPSS